MLDEELEKRVIQDVVLLKLCGFKPIIVHGGGKEISRWVKKVGKEPKFVNGFRVTDEETMEIVEMVLSKVNKKLVQLVEELGIKAIGISGQDGGLLKVTRKYADGEDIGYVGTVCDVEPKILFDLIEKDFLPIVCSVGLDNDFQAYNVNADEAACKIASAVNAEKLAFLTDGMDTLKAVCSQNSKAASMRWRTGYPVSISWMGVFRTVCFLKSLQIKESEQRF